LFSTETAEKKTTDKLSFGEAASMRAAPGLGCNAGTMQEQFRPNTTIPISTNQLQYDAFATHNN
jgi:hypothetical protein